jgi:hypothetical protein
MTLDPNAVARDGVRQDGRVLDAEAPPAVAWERQEIVERAASSVVGPVVALPATELSGFRGHPLIRWLPQLRGRLDDGPGPMLDRPTLSLWESAGCLYEAPASPLEIVGFVSTAPWRRALRAAGELRGFGAGCVLTATRPAGIKLLEADFAGVYVIHVDATGAAEVLVRGRRAPSRQPRMVATRYWEERLFAVALSAGCVRPPPARAVPEPSDPETLWGATCSRWLR